MASVLIFLARLVVVINRRVVFAHDIAWYTCYSVKDLKQLFYLLSFELTNINSVFKKKRFDSNATAQKSLAKMND